MSSFLCACSLPSCRGEIGPDDSVRNADRWDALLRRPFRSIRRVAAAAVGGAQRKGQERRPRGLCRRVADAFLPFPPSLARPPSTSAPALREEGLHRIEIEANGNGRSHDTARRKAG